MKFIDNISDISWKDDTNIVVPVLSDTRRHWSLNRVSFVYVYNISRREEAIISAHHNDCSNVSESNIIDFIGNGNYIYRKKYLKAYRANFEAELLYWFTTGQRFIPEISSVIKGYYVAVPDQNNINDCVPIMRWLDYCRDIKDRLILILNGFEISGAFLRYNELISELIDVEKNGIGSEYSEYNIFTATGRPSNSFANVNYAALNKTDGSRKRFVSRFSNGLLVEVDFSGFHLYLIYTIAGLKFPNNIYEKLSEHYPPNVNPKDYTFQQIYGGIDMSLRNIEPFRSIHKLSADIFDKYNSDELRSFIFGKTFDKAIYGEMSQSKIFNYMLQNLETEFNALVLKKLNIVLRKYKSKLVLYTYDSFLFDYDPQDTMIVFEEVIRCLGNIPFHLNVGQNYHEMKRIR